MAGGKTKWSQETLKRFINEGRGQGDGIDYKPWLTIQDFPSMGRATRVLGWKTKRLHHFFSDIQLKYFYLLEWEQSVVDIKEHYPILDLAESDFDKNGLRFDKFQDKGSNERYILCTTFLITILNKDGSTKIVARSIKNASELEKMITLEKLEIERRYWESKTTDWGIITNRNINSIRAKNIEWIHSLLSYDDDNGVDTAELDDLSDEFIYRLIGNEQPIRSAISSFECDYNLDSGKGILLLKYLIVKRKITIDIDKPISLKDKCTILSITN